MSNKAFSMDGALALATAAAAAKTTASRRQDGGAAGQRKQRAKVQFNVLLTPEAREKLRAVAFAWRTSERELLESFIAQLPDVDVPEVPAPAAVCWAKPEC